jgi:hypothetical protein
MTMEKALLDRFGPLLRIGQLAALLDRSPDGLRNSLRLPVDEAMQSLKEARVKVGRRVYFRTSEVAKVLSDESELTRGD